MEKVRELLKNPLYVGIGAGLIGLIIGWFIIGWGLWPVTYYDASPANLRADLKVDYMRMAVESYAKNQDGALAKKRYTDLGADAAKILADIKTNPGKTFPDDIAKFGNALAGTATQPGATQAAPQGTKPAAGTPQATTAAGAPASSDNSSVMLLVVLCVVLLVIGGALAYVLLIRNRKGGLSSLTSLFSGGAKQAPAVVPQQEYQAQGVETPIAQFMTSYKLGVDMYDDSFSIDAPTGEFLGECGVGISKNIGVGDPKKVTAFEVWLFDKNDIQTVTKVLMSENAYNDPAVLAELQAKGEPIQIGPGAEVLLQTATLQLVARVVDMGYGQGALPQNSFFDRMTLELAIWPKPVQ